MARPDKVAVVEEVRERLSGANAAVLTEYRGLTVSELAQLRRELRASEAEYKVVKNTLTKIAARDAGVDIPGELLTGPTAITFCTGDPIAAAKALRAFSREHPALVVKGGILDGRLLDASETLRLADLESREELLARLAGMFQAIVAQPARLAQASLSKAARLFAALQAKREESGETAPPPEESPAAETPSPPAEEQLGAVDDTPEPDGPAAEAVTAEAHAIADVDATPPGSSSEAVADEPGSSSEAVADEPGSSSEAVADEPGSSSEAVADEPDADEAPVSKPGADTAGSES